MLAAFEPFGGSRMSDDLGKDCALDALAEELAGRCVAKRYATVLTDNQRRFAKSLDKGAGPIDSARAVHVNSACRAAQAAGAMSASSPSLRGLRARRLGLAGASSSASGSRPIAGGSTSNEIRSSSACS